MSDWAEQLRTEAATGAASSAVDGGLSGDAQAGTAVPVSAVEVAAAHDHSDVREFGRTNMTRSLDVKIHVDRRTTVTERRVIEHTEPVPAWWFTCPACGDPMLAQYSCDTWTPEGLAWMRRWRDDHGLPNVVPHGGEAAAMF